MKRIWVTVVSVVLALWFSYYLGYHHGQQGELAAWRATRQTMLFTDNDKLAANPPAPASPQAGPLRIVRTSDLRGLRLFYEDPHSKGKVIPTPRRTENVPDPRSMPVK
jgi:hypothetical protein